MSSTKKFKLAEWNENSKKNIEIKRNKLKD